MALRLLAALVSVVLCAPTAWPADRSVEELAATARPSVVMILATGRDGKRHGVGTGFVVGEGLVATNLHVIGEGRPIVVQLADGTRQEATAVHATDRGTDLALIRVPTGKAVALELADSDRLEQGQSVVALGHPQGLGYSVVAGVVSARKEIDGNPMIQIAIPIEPGNSGGPLLDRMGKVNGVLTLKSAVTANLGFAMPGNALKKLLTRPNPIPMTRWLTLGALDPAEWTQRFGARWRQRGGRIQVEGTGQGFGGRALCLAERPIPGIPFEVTVAVKMDDESGAAGLVFHSDGTHRHYGFYPSSGQMRFTRFEGPDVYSWKVLFQGKSPHYRPGEWNTLRVRVEKGRILCYCNGGLVHESTDTGLTEGQVGLTKFRETKAEFRGFQMGSTVASMAPTAGLMERVTRWTRDLNPEALPQGDLLEKLRPEGLPGMTALRDRARLLERQAARLRQLAEGVHHQATLADLAKAIAGKEEAIDLVHAALLIARLDNEDLDPEPYRREVDRMGREALVHVKKATDDAGRIAALNEYLFRERGFHGSRADYYHRNNSYLNEVIDDREGLPITLSVLYMEVARRVGLRMEGIPLPGHFVVRHAPEKGNGDLLDVFEGGVVLTKAQAGQRVQTRLGRPLRDEDLEPATRKAILARMLNNLLGLARSERDGEGMLRYLDALLILTPDSGEDRWTRAMLRYGSGDNSGALEDTEWLMKHRPEGVDLERVRELRRTIQGERP